LLLNIAEELKMPLLRIARANESSLFDDQMNLQSSEIIRTSTDNALKLIDNYILGIRLALEDASFIKESVSVSSVLYDAALDLTSLAKINGVELELNIAGKFAPVAVNREALHAALVSLGAALIEAIPAHENIQMKLQLATHRSRYGIVAGVYAQTKQLSEQTLKMGRRLQKTSRQPLLNLSHSNGAGVFVADSILNSMGLKLTSSRHHNLYGIGTILEPVNQMQLIT
jgi:hypothetical protein